MSDQSAAHSSPQIDISIKTRYIVDQSVPAEQRYVFSYTITLTNMGGDAAQLISRHWIITDANNDVQEVKGLGVVGKQPLLQPGESYTYTSGVIIATDTGTMTGSYQMHMPDTGEDFEASIPVFGLVTPEKLH